MGRPAKVDRPVKSDLYLPASLDAEIRLLLWSKAEGKVPHGAWSKFFETLAREALARLQPPSQGDPA